LPEFKPFEQPVIAHDKVRYVGEPIAVVLASSVAVGEDALDVIEVEIEDLPPVADWQTASANKSVLFETQAPTARSYSMRARATPTRPSPARPTSAASICAPAATTG
jgi:CO/xanthine dehydrogenase Mo-binding subunit